MSNTSRTYVLSGLASGIGLTTKRLLESKGHKVIGVDIRHNADRQHDFERRNPRSCDLSQDRPGHCLTGQHQQERLAAGSKFAEGKIVAPKDTTALLEAVIRPGDRACLEGDNQKRADFLAACLVKADPKVLHDLHVVQSGIVLPEHIDLFEKGIAKKLDFSYSGPEGAAVARALNSGKIELSAIHTYIELFACYFVDLTPRVAFIKIYNR